MHTRHIQPLELSKRIFLMRTSPSQKSVLSENFRYSLRPVRHSRVFRTDYGCVEKTFLPLIIMYWNFI